MEDRDLLGLVRNRRDFLRADDEEAEALQTKTWTGRPRGNEAFVKKAERRAGRRLRPTPPSGRPRRRTRK